LSEQLAVFIDNRISPTTPTYPVLSRNSDITYLFTCSVLITISIHTLITLPADFCGVDKTVDKYVPVDMNKHL
jgi:hypothetical protein